jgi:hypothetical protein
MFKDGVNPTNDETPSYKATASGDKLIVRVAPGTPGQIQIDKDTFYVRYGHLKYTTEEEYAAKASLYSDADEDFEWSDNWYDGTTLVDGTLPTVPLITGDNAVTLIKVEVGIKADSEDSGTDIGGGRYVGTSKIYDLFVYQMYEAEDELEIVLDENTTVTKDNSEAVNEDGKIVYVYDYGVPKSNETNIVDMVVKALTENTLQSPNTTYAITGLVDTDGQSVDDKSGTLTYTLTNGNFVSDNVELTINDYDADTYESPSDVPVTHVDIVSTSEAGTKSYYRINIYRQSDDASLKTLRIPATADEESATVDLTTATESNGVTHYAVTLPDKYVITDEDGDTFVPVYIESTSDKAVITVTGVNGKFVHETLDVITEEITNEVVDDETGETNVETSVETTTVSYIKVPVSIINSKSNVTFTITSEDGTEKTNHQVDITTVSSNTDVQSIILITATLQSSAEYVGTEIIDGVETEIYKGFLSSDDMGKSKSSVTVSVAAEEATSTITMENKHTEYKNGTTTVWNENSGTTSAKSRAI